MPGDKDPIIESNKELISSASFDDFFTDIGVEEIHDQESLEEWLDALAERPENFSWISDKVRRNFSEVGDLVRSYLAGELLVPNISIYVGEQLSNKVEEVKIGNIISSCTSIDELKNNLPDFALSTSNGTPFTIEEAFSVYEATGDINAFTSKYGLRSKVQSLLKSN